MDNIFIELALVLTAAGVIAYILHFFKQPSIIAYIITGLLIGPLGLYQLHHGEILHGLSDIGITLLLFMVGLDLDISQLKRIGKAAVYAGIGQIVFTCLAGFGLVWLLGINSVSAWYMGIALTFSSTIIVIKLLTEKKDLQSLYGKLAIGIFLIQDVAAIFILILISGISGSDNLFFNNLGIGGNVIFTLAKAFMIGIVIVWLTRFIFPKILKTIERADELMLIFALVWSLGLAAFFTLPLVGFNSAIGGFVAGLALANTGIHHQISGKIKSLRDFFIIIFFIVMGSQLVIQDISSAIIPAIILSLFVLIGKPVIVTTILAIMGYKPRVSFMSGITLAQVSEFSLILMALGLASGHIAETDATVITLVAIITIAVSSYGILYVNKLYSFFHKQLEIFNFSKHSKEQPFGDKPLKNHVVIVGGHRLGGHIINSLEKTKDNILVIDFNPDIAAHYRNTNINVLCGDITDPYIQEIANLNQAKLIISTIPDVKDTAALLEFIKLSHKRIRSIVSAQDEAEAKQLYHAGAHYVILPHFIGGLHLADIIEAHNDSASLRKLREQHLRTINHALR